MKSIIDRARSFVALQNETLDIEHIDVQLCDLPEVLHGYRIALVSDLHIRMLTPYHDRIVQAVAHVQPECILIAGDTMDESTESILAMIPFFRALSDIAPTVAILGNNDCLVGRIHALRDMYRHSGCTLLENETRLLNARGTPLRITGLMDPLAMHRGIEPEHARMRQHYQPLQQIVPPDSENGALIPSVLMVHRPQYARDYAPLAPSLIVSGHAHGGQFRLPHIGGLYAPGQGIFPRYTSGLYPLAGTQLVVSRGLGNHFFPLRLNNRPHLPLLTLSAAKCADSASAPP